MPFQGVAHTSDGGECDAASAIPPSLHAASAPTRPDAQPAPQLLPPRPARQSRPFQPMPPQDEPTGESAYLPQQPPFFEHQRPGLPGYPVLPVPPPPGFYSTQHPGFGLSSAPPRVYYSAQHPGVVFSSAPPPPRVYYSAQHPGSGFGPAPPPPYLSYDPPAQEQEYSSSPYLGPEARPSGIWERPVDRYSLIVDFAAVTLFSTCHHRIFFF